VVGRPLGLPIDENDVRWTVAAESLPWIAQLGIVGQGDVFHPLLYLAIAFMISLIPLFPVQALYRFQFRNSRMGVVT
jgi:hypothetical protein